MTFTAGPNITLTPNGQNLEIAGSAGGDSVFSLNGTSAYYNGGHVGIGTSSPRDRLHVHSAGPTAPIVLSTGSGSEGPASFNVQADSGLGGQGTSFVIYDEVASKYRMVINGYGGVGINTTSPRSLLHVHSSGPTAPITLSTSTGSEGTASFKIQADSGLGGQGTSFVIYDEVASKYRMVINGYGGVGINTTSPRSLLHVHSSGPTAPITLSTSTGSEGTASFKIQADSGLGGQGRSFVIYDEAAFGYRLVINGSGNVGIGTTTPSAKLDVNGNVAVNGNVRTKTVTITGGADVAEPFKMSESEIPAGAVVVIDDGNPGHLKMSAEAYDRKVAGIISGANGIRPGVTLHQGGELDGDQNVALSGRVYVKADAGFGPIRPGDLLTTSDTPGHAMKVTDHSRAQGAILGKAMSGLKEGTGTVLVLVTLQ